MTFGVIFRTDTLIDSRRVTALELRADPFHEAVRSAYGSHYRQPATDAKREFVR